MTDTEATGSDPTRSSSDSSSPKLSKTPRKGEKKPQKKGGFGLFLREVVAELRKVVYPTRQELITYTAVVMVFVLVVMLFVSAIDFGTAKLIGWAFAGD